MQTRKFQPPWTHPIRARIWVKMNTKTYIDMRPVQMQIYRKSTIEKNQFF